MLLRCRERLHRFSVFRNGRVVLLKHALLLISVLFVHARVVDSIIVPSSLLHEVTTPSAVSGNVSVRATPTIEQSLDFSILLFVAAHSAVFNKKANAHFKMLLKAQSK